MNKHCPYCKNDFEVQDGRIFSNHIRWCKKNPRYEEIKKSSIPKISTGVKNFYSNSYNSNPNKCKNCKENLSYEDFQKQKSYCNKEKCRYVAKNAGHLKFSEIRSSLKIKFICIVCNQEKEKDLISKRTICKKCKQLTYKNTKRKDFKQKTRNKQRPRPRNLEHIKNYRKACEFKFGLSNFPNEFNFKLIEEYGWYSPTNKKNNLNGVSRDHMVSVKYGFENKIDPKIISHPANCKLIKHTDNISKNLKCSISYDELLKRIEIWDQKYK